MGLRPTQEEASPEAVTEPTADEVTVPVWLTNQLCEVRRAPFQYPTGWVRASSYNVSSVPASAEL